MVAWKYYPQTIAKIDMMIPDYYGDHINKLHKKVLWETDDKEKFKYYGKLYSELKECSTLNKYYAYRQEAANFLIDYYIKENQYKEAIKIAELWEQMYPYDFQGKFKYAEVLEYNNRNNALDYYAKLYKKYDDIPDVLYNYVNLLSKVGNLKLVKKLKLKLDRLIQRQIEFKIYYRDSRNNYSEDQTLVIDSFDYLNEGDVYTFNFEKTFNKFKGFRLDIEKILLSFDISELNVIVNNNNNIEKKLAVKNIYHMEKVNDKYTILGNDPYIEFIIPNEFLNKKENLQFNISIQISKKK